MVDNIDFLKPENRLKATPLDLLKQGIRNRQWEAIDAAYVMLTGEVAPITQSEAVKPKRSRQRKVQAEPVVATVIEEPSQPQSQPQVETAGLPSDCVTTATKGKHKLLSRKQSVLDRPHTNKWKDDLSEAVDEIVKDRKVSSEILNNRRPDMPWLKVRCSECRDVFEVEPGSLPHGGRLTKRYKMKWKCNDCVIGNVHSTRDADLEDDDILEDED